MIRAHHRACRELIAAAFPGIPWRDESTLDVELEGARASLTSYSDRKTSGVRVRVPLEPASIPVRVYLSPKNDMMLAGPPTMLLGDAAFDARWNLRGTPHEIVAAALDETTRAALGACPPLARTTVDEGHVELTCSRRHIDADGVRRLAQFGARLGVGLSRAYAEQMREHGRVGGQLAAQTAHAAMQAQVDASRRSESVGQWITLAFVLVFLLTIAAIFVLVAFIS